MLPAAVAQLVVVGATIILGATHETLARNAHEIIISCKGQMVRASYYGLESGHRTASGLPFDGSQLLVAHRTLPFHTRLRLTYGSRSIVVPVEDRGPFVKGRDIDLSVAVARRLGTINAGVARICLELLK